MGTLRKPASLYWRNTNALLRTLLVTNRTRTETGIQTRKRFHLFDPCDDGKKREDREDICEGSGNFSPPRRVTDMNEARVRNPWPCERERNIANAFILYACNMYKKEGFHASTLTLHPVIPLHPALITVKAGARSRWYPLPVLCLALLNGNMRDVTFVWWHTSIWFFYF